MEKLIESDSIVLKGQDFGESHRIITLFTVSHGKIKALARGAKRSKKRFLNALEDLNYLVATLKPPRTEGLYHLHSVGAKDTFPEIKNHAIKFACAGLGCELVDLWTRELSPERDIFELLLWFLNELNQGMEPYTLTLYFKTRLLKIVGYGPEWTNLKKNGLRISDGTLRCLDFVQISPLNRLNRLKMSKQNIKEAWALLKAMHLKHLEKEPKSYYVLRQIASATIQTK
ncbi:DNA recombination and repair protein RecO [Dissulfuribacter thermophilus]|uniref:DNA repair protein RecO n=1 Tax=Dissulfuribacter thermophilus TaxID=1156395 RepID=A0A1B9F4F2_9BACT|nr:DNA repair protein RecO [Dissulfuribacter thermophilus]OCC14704.1 DNA recombination and repair protein RecO [Dissulfuribacter thermophilus]